MNIRIRVYIYSMLFSFFISRMLSHQSHLYLALSYVNVSQMQQLSLYVIIRLNWQNISIYHLSCMQSFIILSWFTVEDNGSQLNICTLIIFCGNDHNIMHMNHVKTVICIRTRSSVASLLSGSLYFTDGWRNSAGAWRHFCGLPDHHGEVFKSHRHYCTGNGEDARSLKMLPHPLTHHCANIICVLLCDPRWRSQWPVRRSWVDWRLRWRWITASWHYKAVWQLPLPSQRRWGSLQHVRLTSDLRNAPLHTR